MSMIGNFELAPASRIEAVLDDPESVEAYLLPEGGPRRLRADIWGRPPEEDDTLGYLLEYFGMLKFFICKGAEDGLGLIVYVN